MTGKFVVSLAAASLIVVGSALAQQPPAEPQSPARGQPGTMMGPGMMGLGMMGHGDWAPWMMGLGRHHEMMMAPGMIQAFAEGKLAFLKSLLGITEAQSGPWTDFADVVRAQAKSMAESQQKRVPTPDQPELTMPQWVDLPPTDDGRASRRDEEDQAGIGCSLPSADAGAAAEGRSTYPHALICLRAFALSS